MRGPKRLLALRGDEHLVSRLRNGDEVAFEVIYERHVPGVLSFCRHMLGSREEAEDAVQQVFTAAHRDLLRDGREIHLKAWLYTIARNRCFSTLRARREVPDEQAEPSTDGLVAEVEQRAELRELVDDLHDLPEEQRAALVLSELRDLSHAEIADVLGCRVANVKGLVFRARAGLGERREARDAACEDIRQELATAQGGTLRRGRLRHHLRACEPCSNYLEDVRRQRRLMAAILPVIPTAGLKSSVLAAVGIGGGGAAGGAAAGGGLLAALMPAGGATIAKVAIVGAVVVGGGGLAGEAALDGGGSPAPASPVAPRTPAAAPAVAAPAGQERSERAERKRSAAKPSAAAAERARLKQERRRLKEKRQKAKHEQARGRGGSQRPAAGNRGRRSRGEPPVKSKRRADTPEPRPRRVPRRTRTRRRPAAPIEPRGKALGGVEKTPPAPRIPTAAG